MDVFRQIHKRQSDSIVAVLRESRTIFSLRESRCGACLGTLQKKKDVHCGCMVYVPDMFSKEEYRKEAMKK
jgi:hypothetical protein